MDRTKLAEILKKHIAWVNGSSDGLQANLRVANLCGANLGRADLRGADLSEADLREANLCEADLCGANLCEADLCGANLCGANLCEADLCGADLRGADLSEANLSGAIGLLDPQAWIKQFETDPDGVIVFKVFGLYQSPPKHWIIRAGQTISEIVNTNRTNECGCGVNFATKAWIEKEKEGQEIWKCRISWLALSTVVVPFGTTGKARCGELQLLAVI